MGIFFGVVAEDAIDSSGLEEDVGFKFEGSLCGCRVGGDEGASGACAEENDPAFFEVASSAAADVGFGDTLHAYGGHEPGVATEGFECILECEAVHDGGKHPHVVGSRLVDVRVPGGELCAPEYIAAAHDDGNLRSGFGGTAGLFRQVNDGVHGDAAFTGLAETFSRDLEDDASWTLIVIRLGLT